MLRARSLILMSLGLLSIQTAEASCLEDGGRIFQGQCYCRTALIEGRATVLLNENDENDLMPSNRAVLKGSGKCSPIWGLELTFTQEEVQNEEIKLRAKQKGWADSMRAKCANPQRAFKCHVESSADQTHQKVVYDCGYEYIVKLDHKVLEITGSPISNPEWNKIEKLVKEDLFGTAQELGLRPFDLTGGGHMHLDLPSQFKGNPGLILDFVADFSNHPGLSICALGEGFINNPPLALLSLQQQTNMMHFTMQSRVAGRDHPSLERSSYLAHTLLDHVFNQTLDPNRSAFRNHAVNLLNITPDMMDQGYETVELRALRPQRSWEDVDLLMKLFESRLRFLEKYPGVIYRPVVSPFSGHSGTDAADFQIKQKEKEIREFFNSPNLVQSCINDFYRYVTAAGLDWEEYRKLLSIEHAAVKPFDCGGQAVPLNEVRGPATELQAISSLAN